MKSEKKIGKIHSKEGGDLALGIGRITVKTSVRKKISQ